MDGTITYLEGDATVPQAKGNKIIAHVCNDAGGWGRGFVLAISRRWPEPESEYRRWHRERAHNDFGLGAVQLVKVKGDTWVANMIGQHGVRGRSNPRPIRYEALETCLRRVAEEAVELDASIHMPRIGCGLAGGTWSEVEPIVTSSLVEAGIEVFVYDFE
jgi:O-acetyl-ADP-ribose deacetylase (regulator of RNase III)